MEGASMHQRHSLEAPAPSHALGPELPVSLVLCCAAAFLKADIGSPSPRRLATRFSECEGGMIADGSGNPSLGKGHVPVEHIGVSSQSRRGLFCIYDFTILRF